MVQEGEKIPGRQLPRISRAYEPVNSELKLAVLNFLKKILYLFLIYNQKYCYASLSFDFQFGHTNDFKNGICCFSCFKAQHLRVA